MSRFSDSSVHPVHESEDEHFEEDSVHGSEYETDGHFNNAAKSDEEELFTTGIRKLEHLGLIDIGNLAAWGVSTYKHGYGIKELREDSPFSYWQSDGQQPHFITIHFTKRVTVQRLSFYFNYQLDESYTPSKILVLAGSGEHDLMEVSSKEFFEPSGWQHIFFKGVRSDNLLKCYLIKICFLSNHQNGKDSHVRSIKVFSPLSENAMRSDIDSSLGTPTCGAFLESGVSMRVCAVLILDTFRPDTLDSSGESMLLNRNDEYILESSAKDGVSKLYFEGKRPPAGHGHSDHVLIYNQKAGEFSLERLDSVVKMSKSREPEKLQQRMKALLNQHARGEAMKEQASKIRKPATTLRSRPLSAQSLARSRQKREPSTRSVPTRPSRLSKAQEAISKTKQPESENRDPPKSAVSEEDLEFDREFEEALEALDDEISEEE
ncbi:hypothetical protein KL925_002988 [Ogataea polymorpha]|nr:hypothetical protein KL925_002988 [Ogataea polymorpha]KAG7936462.1 hypothetical protein KL934_001929 [Ogataea polymorpha]